MRKLIRLNILLFKYLSIGFLCLFFTGSLNVTYQYFHTDVNKGRTYCCCAGEMVGECNCSGECCSSENDYSLSISKRSCGELKTLKTVSIELVYIIDQFGALKNYYDSYNPFHGYSLTKYLTFIEPIDKPPQILSVS